MGVAHCGDNARLPAGQGAGAAFADIDTQLKSRAALAGLPLSDYLIREVRKIAEQPTADELRRRLQEREACSGKQSPTQALRAVIVVDASAVLELLLRTPKAPALDALLLDGRHRRHAPHLLDVEVAQTLRRLTMAGDLADLRAQQALDDFGQLAIERHAHTELLTRAWQLRTSISAYDAMYVALAEGLDAMLVTCDVRLGRAHGHEVEVRIV